MEVSVGICGSGKSRQISAVRPGFLQVDLYLPRLWAASRIKDFIWPDCESEVRSAAGRAASEHCATRTVPVCEHRICNLARTLQTWGNSIKQTRLGKKLTLTYGAVRHLYTIKLAISCNCQHHSHPHRYPG